MCGRNADEIGKLLGVPAIEGYESRTIFIQEGGGIMDSKMVNHRALNLCDYERSPANHKKIDVVVCPICKTLINSMAVPVRKDMVQTMRRA
jgi:hypothetical protein